MRKRYLLSTILLLVLAALYNLKAQDFVYTPINPAFGGNPYNYSWLLSSAQALDTYEDPTKTDLDYRSYSSNPLDDFTESLNRQILSQLSREIVSRQFGENALEDGTYILGNYQIEIGNSGSGIVISIIDILTGSTTNVSIPYF
jgi:curli production assembly/transport component CsgF